MGEYLEARVGWHHQILKTTFFCLFSWVSGVLLPSLWYGRLNQGRYDLHSQGWIYSILWDLYLRLSPHFLQRRKKKNYWDYIHKFTPKLFHCAHDPRAKRFLSQSVHKASRNMTDLIHVKGKPMSAIMDVEKRVWTPIDVL